MGVVPGMETAICFLAIIALSRFNGRGAPLYAPRRAWLEGPAPIQVNLSLS